MFQLNFYMYVLKEVICWSHVRAITILIICVSDMFDVPRIFNPRGWYPQGVATWYIWEGPEDMSKNVCF